MVHIPVMVDEVVQLLLHPHDRVIIDATIGDGGHAEALLEADQTLKIIGIDRDENSLEVARKRLIKFSDRIVFHRGSYSGLGSILESLDVAEKVDGALLDLGVSSSQLDDPKRGFGYASEGPLDMRMESSTQTAKETIAAMSLEDLSKVIKKYGEVKRARRIARSIKAAQAKGGLETTLDLKRAVEAALGAEAGPATMSKVFQSIRIVVNRELENLKIFLEDILKYLNQHARLVFISYHSLEDREIKHFLKRESKACLCPPGTPVCVCNHEPRLRLLTRRALKPSKEEIASNPRARSARLRAAQVL
jgi:16S rRNA (cytosine1402-N4)-methyltransferase